MTDPTGGAQTPQGPGDWQAPPPPSPTPQFQQAPVATGPAPGVAYADLVTRIIALVIDGIILAIPYWILLAVLGFLGDWAAFILSGIVYLAWTAVYFVYTWTRQRASYGQKFLSLETVNAADGATLTQDQAIRRWAFLFGPAALAQVFSFGGGLLLGTVGLILSLLAALYSLYLLYTTSQSPKRQGYHDVQAGTVVVKRLT